MKLKYRLTLIFLLGFATIAYAKSTKFSYIHTNFTAGELSPKMDGRVDFPKYFNGVKTLDNFIIYPQGGVVRRSGFEYINTVKTSNEQVRLIPFEFSTTQAYILELGDLYMRFYMDGGQIQSPDAETKALLHFDGNNNSTTITNDAGSVSDFACAGDAKIKTALAKIGSGSLYLDGTGDYVYASDHDDWDFDTNDMTIEAWVRINYHKDTAIAQQYVDDDNRWVFWLNWKSTGVNGGVYAINFQANAAAESAAVDQVSADVIIPLNYWVHVAISLDASEDEYYLFLNGASQTVSTDSNANDELPNLTAGLEVGEYTTTITGNIHGMCYMDEVRISNGLCRWIADFNPPSIAYPLNSGETPTEIVTPYTLSDLPALKFAQSADTMWIVHEDYKPRKLTRTAHTTWPLTSYAPTADPFTTATTYPAAVAFFEERLCFGGTLATPQGLFLSVSGNFEDMTTGANADDAMAVEIAADQVNTVRWLEPGRVLIVGTVGGEWKMGASSLDDPITPTNITVRRETAYGSANVQPETVGKNVLFVQRAGKKIRELGYNFDVDGYMSHDLSILADHIIDSKIIDMAYQQEPDSILWCVTEDGTLLSLTYQKDHEVVAWSEHPVGGTDAEVKSVAVIPGDEEDEVWISVERTISGVSTNRVNYIERMKPLFSGTDTTDAFFVDSGLSYEGGAVTSVSGLDHLEGVTVVALADGIPLTAATATTPADLDLTVASGAITLGTSVSTLHAGFAYNSNIETLRIAVPSESSGTIQGKTKQISYVTLRLLESLECKVGPNSSNLVSYDFADGNTAFSGDKGEKFTDDYNEEGYIYIRQDVPLPLTVLAIIPEVRVSD